ncbi:MAG: tetratricopeptide repeat protein [Planctomycetes bacterium]|nr:tetratricopeptide repeat protein [Planctomycetota bacterium]
MNRTGSRCLLAACAAAALLLVSPLRAQTRPDLAGADRLCEAGKYEEALAAYQAAIAAAPDLAAAYSGAGKCLIGLNRVSEAVALLEKAVKQPAADAENCAVLGQAYYWDATRVMNDPDDPRAGYEPLILADAETQLKRAIERDSSLHVAHYYLGKVRVLLERPAEAAAAFLEAARLAPAKFRAYKLQAYCEGAECLDQAGDPDGMRKAYADAVAFDPTDRTIYESIWKLFGAKKERHADGLALLQALAKSRPSAAMPLYYIAYFHGAMEQKKEARQAFEKVIQTAEGKKFSAAWARLGEIYFREDGDEKKAETFLLKALDLNAADVEAAAFLQFLAARAKERGDLGRFVAIQEAILKRQPTNGQVWNNLAWYYHDRRQLAEAAKHYKKALEYAPDDPVIKCGAAKVMNDLNRNQEAEQLWQDALGIDPNNVDALMNYGWFLKKHGRPKEAAEKFAKVVEVDPGNRRAREELERLR